MDRAARDAAIAAFWEWWRVERTTVERALVDGDAGLVAGPIASRVATIDPGLRTELAPGGRARFALTVSAGGDPALRSTAERWLLAAPAADAGFEFHAARRPAPSGATRIRIDDRELDLAATRVAIVPDERSGRLGVVVHHPVFATLDDPARERTAALALELALGEDAVERAIGRIEHTVSAPVAGTDLETLAGHVATLGATDEPDWVVLQAHGADAAPVIVVARRPLSHVDRPAADLHGMLVIDYAHAEREDGLPEPEVLDAMRDVEEAFIAELGEAIHVVAFETHRGERTTHFYCEIDGDAATRAARLGGRPGLAGRPRVQLRAAIRSDRSTRVSGQSSSVIENIATSRSPGPSARRECLRRTPSNEPPTPAMARRERSFRASVLRVTRVAPSASNAWASSSSFASGLTTPPCQGLPYQVWPISMRPSAGAMSR